MWSPSTEAPRKDKVFLNSLADPYICKPHVATTYWASAQWCFNTLSVFSPSYKVLGQLPDTDVYIDIDAYEEVGPFLSF